MARKSSTAMPLNAKSTPAERESANRQHHQEMADHLLTNTLRAGHGGHMLGKSGPGSTGHDLPPSDAHLQSGQYIPQAVFNTATKDGGSGFDDPSAKDYGTTDAGDE